MARNRPQLALECSLFELRSEEGLTDGLQRVLKISNAYVVMAVASPSNPAPAPLSRPHQESATRLHQGIPRSFTAIKNPATLVAHLDFSSRSHRAISRSASSFGARPS
mmetsp:Transcript_49878/g.154074  ORF Transcript_49878/g.154074 Transcript_49878/m.154074 type:complete len:108 (-) Transcript_49878:747-1070(-)